MAARPRRRGAGTHRAGTWHRGPTERAPRGPSHQTAVPRHGTAAAGGGFDSSGKPGAESCPFAPLSSPVRASIVPFGLRGVLEDSSRAGLPAAGATPSIPGIEAQGHVVRKDGHAGFSPGPVGAGRYRGRRGLRRLSGAAWLVSTQVGQVTLLDGSTAEVAAQVPVAPPGTRLDVVQQGANAYAVNRTAGSVRRVDGGTFTVSQPAIPLPNAGDGLQALAAPGVLYALDTSRGVLTSADPLTLATRTAPVPLATPVTGESAVLDEAGRLWVLDGASGSLVWIDHGQRHIRQGLAGPGGILVLAGSAPVVVDLARHVALTLDPESADTGRTTELDLRSADRVQVSGSPDGERIYLVAARGLLTVCELATPTCATAVPLAGDLGAAVESGRRVFVPDYDAGRVWVVDLDQDRVVAEPRVLDPHTRFQLVSRDGVVFFNDPDSEHAGVIRFDGGVRPVAKYDP